MVCTGGHTPDLEAVLVRGIFDGCYKCMVVRALVQEMFFGNDMASHTYLR